MIRASPSTLPGTVAALRDWDGKDTPDEAVYAALVEDFKKVAEDNTAAFVGKRLNYEISGIRSKIIASVAKAQEITAPPYKEQMIAADKMWGDRLIWAKIKQSGNAFTDFYLLRSLDLERNVDGSIAPVAQVAGHLSHRSARAPSTSARSSPSSH